MTLTQAAKVLSISAKTLRLAGGRGAIAAQHPLADGPWVFNRTAIETKAASVTTLDIRRSRRTPAQRCVSSAIYHRAVSPTLYYRWRDFQGEQNRANNILHSPIVLVH
jgi:hypothetical protein